MTVIDNLEVIDANSQWMLVTMILTVEATYQSHHTRNNDSGWPEVNKIYTRLPEAEYSTHP